MNTISKTLKASSGAAALIVAGIPPLAQGQEARETLHITGNVVCAQCSLEEIRPTQSDQVRANFTSSYTHKERLWDVFARSTILRRGAIWVGLQKSRCRRGMRSSAN